MKPIPFLLCFLFLSLTSEAQTYSPEVEERIRVVESGLRKKYGDDKTFSLTERMKASNIHGISIAVINDYKLHWAKAYGFSDVASSTPMTTETMLQAASISKSLNAVGVLRLAQMNKIDLNSDINEYLKSWKFPYNEKGKKPITTTNLLSHTAGTSVHGFWGYTRDAKLPTVVQILNGEGNSATVRSMFDAGTKVQYSGGGTVITQLMVMDITGSSYEEYEEQQVLKPLGMSNSTFAIPGADVSSASYATGYKRNGQQITDSNFYVHPELAAAGLWTTPSDLSKYIVEIQLANEGMKTDFLNKEIANRMLTPVLGSTGLGVFITNKNGTKYFEHGGSNQGFRCVYMGSLERGKGIVVMINSENMEIAWEVINSIANAYGWDEFR